ncbi:MAG: hypothetical protein JWO06_2875, partial [Bacteroidota bacterium]|nr:hypothetical protein [Bacteroidota bacterium]
NQQTTSWGLASRDCITIKLKNLRSLNIWVDGYSNPGGIKRALDKMHDARHSANYNQSVTIAYKSLKVDTIADDEIFRAFSGSYWISGFKIYAWPIVIIALFIYDNPVSNAPMGIAIWIIGLAMMSVIYTWATEIAELNYFLVSEKHLVVKNHLWPPYKIIYKLEDIEKVTVGQRSPVPQSYSYTDALKIVFSNYDERIFPAASLNRSDWRGLKEILLRLNIPVTDSIGLD